jgi:hypothetical protein
VLTATIWRLPAAAQDHICQIARVRAKHETFRDFAYAILTFLREEVPRNWRIYCDEVTDNFRIISPKDFRILA